MRARSRAGVAVMSALNSSTVPEVGGNSPEIRLNSVVLPAPFGPRIARRSPGRTSRSTSRTAWTPPKRRPTPRKRRIGSARSAMGWPASMAPLPGVPERDLLGVADPRRRLALLARGVLAVDRRTVRREEAAERLVHLGDPPERLHVRRAVAVLVLDDLLQVDVADRLAVL